MSGLAAAIVCALFVALVAMCCVWRCCVARTWLRACWWLLGFFATLFLGAPGLAWLLIWFDMAYNLEAR